ncbi:MAG: CPBP family intramembrane metalloprotease [Acidaminococcaceae bacterium]|nr:CPBP family intramembrane metalloprotease [Acidaminococcaceae bacterium]
MTTSQGFLKRYPIIIALIAFVLAITGVLYSPHETFLKILEVRVVLCVIMLFFLWLISGNKTLSQINNQTGYVIKKGAGLWIIALFVGLFAFYGHLTRAGGMPAGWQSRAIIIFFMYFFICLFEELCFRGVLNDAIVYQFRNSKHVFLMSALISTLIFGAAHCLGSSLTSGLAWAQAVLKTLSCAVFGFALLVLYWKTRNILACGIVHTLYDYFVSFSSSIFISSPKLSYGTYIRPDKAGSMLNIHYVYPITILITGLIAWRIWKKVGKTIDFEEMRKNW